MTDRQRLVEIMAREVMRYRFNSRPIDHWLPRDLEMIDMALAAAEREGFLIVAPPDGR